ncbi:hypothetical protein SLEP1_g34339 [Rubroshorea leprosula]|uniref:Uncharacterized protein n=1 Tax=Rubroshorea leprosula TaxID=152421 RepID=A0AAV5KJR0_9ROSI|nr:hypothetical protein SLEP1_g34339 [Rubroshorea leprosula]
MEIVMGSVVDENFLAMSYSIVNANKYLNTGPLVEYVQVIVAKAITGSLKDQAKTSTRVGISPVAK